MSHMMHFSWIPHKFLITTTTAMTIDGSWIVGFKKTVPEAFTPKAGFTPQVVVCDGQIRLMSPYMGDSRTWECYIHNQFETYLQRCFENVSTVVLCFDDYNKVPIAKAPTQMKRRRNIPSLDFSDRDALPVLCPDADQWPRFMANRTFKTRLIHLITHTLGQRALRSLSPNQVLIIDWQHPVMLFRGGAEQAETITDFSPLGESDVKFCRYGSMFPNVQVDSVDGDNLIIGLLSMQTGFKGNYTILHLETKVETPSKKRLITGEPAAPSRPKRVYEHVNIRVLYDGLLKRMVPRSHSVTGHEISMIVSLIGLSGTDFTRPLPQLSGKTLYEMIPDIWPRVIQCYDPETRSLKADLVADRLVSKIYSLKFAKHCMLGRDIHSYTDVLRQINTSKLCQKTKEALPSDAVIHCNARNINWLLEYWTQHDYPDPVQPMFGFKRIHGKIGHDDFMGI